MGGLPFADGGRVQEVRSFHSLPPLLYLQPCPSRQTLAATWLYCRQTVLVVRAGIIL
jgi:hypothetical protein